MSMTKIQEIRVGSGGAATLTFSAIPSFYTDLYLVLSSRNTINEDQLRLRLNNSSSSFTSRFLYGTGSGVGTYSDGSNPFPAWQSPNPFTANTFGSHLFYFPNYRSSVAKSISVEATTENNATFSYQQLNAVTWSNSEAITSIELGVANGSYVEHSSATLYGINRTQAVGKPKAIGGVITFANGHWVHTFISNGSFVPLESMSAEALIVAGGGGGGGGTGSMGAGGGAGGLLYYGVESSKAPNGGLQSLSAGVTYPVTVGSGGPGQLTVRGVNGSDSQFNTLVATGGGGGASLNNLGLNAAGNGGSGGGSGFNNQGEGQGISGQGFAGGRAYGAGADYGGGGGGGAGGAGVTAAVGTAPLGGPGLGYSISGTRVEYAGGGGGSNENGVPLSTGRFGGGTGGRAPSTTATSGIANRGGGGGGSYANAGAGNGGSGVVIIRYPAE